MALAVQGNGDMSKRLISESEWPSLGGLVMVRCQEKEDGPPASYTFQTTAVADRQCHESLCMWVWNLKLFFLSIRQVLQLSLPVLLVEIVPWTYSHARASARVVNRDRLTLQTIIAP